MTVGRLIGMGVASLALAAVPAGIDTRALVVDQTGTALGTVGNPLNVTGTAGGGSVTQGTTPWVVGGSLTNNNAAPGATNVGVLPAVANAAAPTLVEGNQALLSTNLTGALRCIVSGTTVPGSAVPLPVSVGMNGAGAVLKHMTSALGAYPTPGDQALAVAPGVFDGTNWQTTRNVTGAQATTGAGLLAVGPLHQAVVLGSNPTAVTAGQFAYAPATRGGIPFALGGHPNTITIRANYTTAQTDTAIVTVAAGTKIVATSVMVTASNANTVNPSVVIGFGTANTPTTTGVIGAHPGIAPGSGFGKGDGGTVIGIGADDEDLRITSSVPTGGSLDVVISYFTSPS